MKKILFLIFAGAIFIVAAQAQAPAKAVLKLAALV
jgi:hypothetical protein